MQIRQYTYQSIIVKDDFRIDIFLSQIQADSINEAY